MAVDKDFENNNENDLCYLTGERYVCVSFTDRKMINRIKKIYEERAEEFKYLTQNKDGSICAKIPKKWFVSIQDPSLILISPRSSYLKNRKKR